MMLAGFVAGFLVGVILYHVFVCWVVSGIGPRF